MTGSRILGCFLLLSVSALAQVDFSQYPYLLRLEHENFGGKACVLLARSGAFHLESESGDSTKIFEGALSAKSLEHVQDALNDDTLVALSEHDIQEPLLRSRDLLQIGIFRKDHWQDLFFHSLESEAPYRRSLKPLVDWLDGLHKLPHSELSEDEGKNNCLPPKRIALKRREEPREPSPASAPAGPAHGLEPVRPARRPDPAPARLRMLSMQKTSGAAEQRCLLVKGDGTYRTERQVQKIGSKKVEIKIDGGKLSPAEFSEFENVLNDPALANIRHRKTSRLVLPMSGEMLDLEILRSSGPEEVVLSSTFNHRDVPFFYSGDGDIRSAGGLLKFIAEHVDNNPLGALDPGLRNDCSDAP
ncbi:MAG: hypothetical protein J2P13_06835 [Acidobacteria bacterium]|nr:hypothetical protein [Acidobacteriota bacterium]